MIFYATPPPPLFPLHVPSVVRATTSFSHAPFATLQPTNQSIVVFSLAPPPLMLPRGTSPRACLRA